MSQVMLEDCHIADTGGEGAEFVDGISLHASSSAMLRRCLFTNNSRAAIGFCGEGKVSAEVDLCEFVGNIGAILHADYPDERPCRIRKDASLRLTRNLIRDGCALWAGDRFLVGDVTEEDNLIDDRIPRAFIRAGCGGFSGVEFARGNVSRAAAMRGSDVPPFLPFALPGPGLSGSSGMFFGQYLATNFERPTTPPVTGAPQQTGDEHAGAGAGEGAGVEEDDDESITHTESEEQAGSSHEADDALGLRSMRAKGARRSVFGGELDTAAEASVEEEDEEELERARLRALEEAEIDMDHFKRLVRRGHNISGTGAELAELLGIDSLSHTSDEEQGDAALQHAVAGPAEPGSKASNTTQTGKSKRKVKEEDDGLMNQMMPKKADPQVRKLIADIYARVDKEADAEGARFESEWHDSVSVP